jgi:PEP-CTERM motif
MKGKLTVACLSLAFVAGALLGGTPGRALAGAPLVVIGIEDSTTSDNQSPGNGFVGNLFDGAFPGSPYIVASDGEAVFDPFGFGADTSDGINFSVVGHVWNQAPGSIWTPLGNQTWVLPADLTGIGCGIENSTTCEPIGHFVSPDPWVPAAIGDWAILDPNGRISDDIQTFNVNGQAQLLFYSDPTIPEPASLALLGTALAGFGVIRRRRKAA